MLLYYILNSASVLVGKALIGNETALSRYGVELKKGATATEIISAVTATFVNQAEAAANPLTIMRNELNNTAATLGIALLPTITAVVKIITTLVVKVGEWAEAHPGLSKVLFITAAAIGALLLVVGSFLLLLPGLIAGIGALGVVFAVSMLPIYATVAAITAIIAGLILLWTNWDTIWNWIMNHKAIAIIIAAILALVAPILLVPIALVALAKNWGTVWDGIRNVTDTVVNGIISAINVVTGAFGSWLAVILKVVTAIPGTFLPMKDQIVGALSSVVDSLKAGINHIDLTAKAAGDMTTGVDNASDALGKLSDATDDVVLSARQMEEQYKANEKALNDFGEQIIKALVARYKEQEDAEIDSLDRRIQSNRDFSRDVIREYDDQLTAALRNLDTQEKAEIAVVEQYKKLQEDYFRTQMGFLDDEEKRQLKTLRGNETTAEKVLRDKIDNLDEQGRAEQRALRDAQNQQELHDLTLAVSEARTVEERTRAAKRLNDFKAQLLRETADAERAATRVSLQLEIQALKDKTQVDSDAIKVDFDNKRDAARKEADQRKEELAKQLADIREHYDLSKQQAQDHHKEIVRLEEGRTETTIKELQKQKDAVKKHYDELTAADAVAAEARKMALGQDQDGLITLLGTYNKDWQDQGTSFGASLLKGLNSQKQSVETAVAGMLSLVKTGGTAATGSGTAGTGGGTAGTGGGGMTGTGGGGTVDLRTALEIMQGYSEIPEVLEIQRGYASAHAEALLAAAGTVAPRLPPMGGLEFDPTEGEPFDRWAWNLNRWASEMSAQWPNQEDKNRIIAHVVNWNAFITDFTTWITEGRIGDQPNRPSAAFAKGGVVPGPIGQPMQAIVHGGETILPVGADAIMPIVMAGKPPAIREIHDNQLTTNYTAIRKIINEFVIRTLPLSIPDMRQSSIANIPHFERGGIITGARGQAVPAIVHGGDTILPIGSKPTEPAMLLNNAASARLLADSSSLMNYAAAKKTINELIIKMFPPTAPDITHSDSSSPPHFERGGIVPGPHGEPMQAIVHGGETITPAGAIGGITFVFHGDVYGMPDFEQKVGEALRRHKIRGGLTGVVA